MKLTFQTLANYGQPVAPLQQMEYLEDATKGFDDIVRVISDYKRANIAIATRNFDAMVTYIKANAPLVTARELGYVGSISSSTIPILPTPAANDSDDIEHRIMKILETRYAGLAINDTKSTMIPAAQTTSQQHFSRQQGRTGGGRNHGGRGGRTGGRTPDNNNKAYCFEHGYGNHRGTACKTMFNDSSYTHEMKIAAAPALIGGYQGHA
jgi:hypothetical protein